MNRGTVTITATTPAVIRPQRCRLIHRSVTGIAWRRPANAIIIAATPPTKAVVTNAFSLVAKASPVHTPTQIQARELPWTARHAATSAADATASSSTSMRRKRP